MPELTTCPSCGRHAMRAEKSCPHCGRCARSSPGMATVAMVGLALAASACGDKDESPAEPDYGIAAYDSGDSDDTGDTAD